MQTKYGYIRVSSRDQNEDRQLIALAPYNISKHNLFLDKKSGKDFNRPAYKRLLRRIKPGDLLILKSIDRLGRNYHEIIEQWRHITREKRVDVKVLDMPLLDTSYGKDLLGTFISDLVLQVLSFSAQLERESILQRQAEGIAAAKARGIKFGRKAAVLPASFEKLYVRWRSGELSAEETAAICGISRRTLYKLTEEIRQSDERRTVNPFKKETCF